MAAKKSRRKRKKLGRPKGTGGPPGLVRRHRVVMSSNDGELEKLESLAEAGDLPLGTAAYQLIAPSLARVRESKRRGDSCGRRWKGAN